MPRAKHLVQVAPNPLRCYKCWTLSPTVEHVGLMWVDMVVNVYIRDDGTAVKECAAEYLNLCPKCQLVAIDSGAMIADRLDEDQWTALVQPEPSKHHVS